MHVAWVRVASRVEKPSPRLVALGGPKPGATPGAIPAFSKPGGAKPGVPGMMLSLDKKAVRTDEQREADQVRP